MRVARIIGPRESVIDVLIAIDVRKGARRGRR
jgi:hypothetical protein